MHELIDGLEGIWAGEGVGRYPTIETFRYLEEVTFERLGDKPVLAYSQRTRSPKGHGLHAESGFLRFNEEGVEWVLAQPTGIAETHRGTPVEGSIVFESVGLISTPTAASVTAVRRSVELDGDVLRYSLAMSAVGQPLLPHLEAELRRT